MPTPAADDFTTIRSRLEELKKDKQEVLNTPEAVAPSSDFTPTPNVNNEDYLYCGGAFKMENLGGQAKQLSDDMGNWSALDNYTITINGVSYSITQPKMIVREYP